MNAYAGRQSRSLHAVTHVHVETKRHVRAASERIRHRKKKKEKKEAQNDPS